MRRLVALFAVFGALALVPGCAGSRGTAVLLASKIAFWSDRDGGNFEIYVMNADGSGQTNRTNSVSDDVEPSFPLM